jgi:hypothetical protein
MVKVKVSLLQAVEAPRVARGFRLPHFLDKRLIDGGKVVSPTRQPHFTPRFLFNMPGTHFYWRLSRPQSHSVAERIR